MPLSVLPSPATTNSVPHAYPHFHPQLSSGVPAGLRPPLTHEQEGLGEHAPWPLATHLCSPLPRARAAARPFVTRSVCQRAVTDGALLGAGAHSSTPRPRTRGRPAPAGGRSMISMHRIGPGHEICPGARHASRGERIRDLQRDGRSRGALGCGAQAPAARGGQRCPAPPRPRVSGRRSESETHTRHAQ